jgi:hypothetical protein
MAVTRKTRHLRTWTLFATVLALPAIGRSQPLVGPGQREPRVSGTFDPQSYPNVQNPNGLGLSSAIDLAIRNDPNDQLRGLFRTLELPITTRVNVVDRIASSNASCTQSMPCIVLMRILVDAYERAQAETLEIREARNGSSTVQAESGNKELVPQGATGSVMPGSTFDVLARRRREVILERVIELLRRPGLLGGTKTSDLQARTAGFFLLARAANQDQNETALGFLRRTFPSGLTAPRDAAILLRAVYTYPLPLPLSGPLEPSWIDLASVTRDLRALPRLRDQAHRGPYALESLHALARLGDHTAVAIAQGLLDRFGGNEERGVTAGGEGVLPQPTKPSGANQEGKENQGKENQGKKNDPWASLPATSVRLAAVRSLIRLRHATAANSWLRAWQHERNFAVYSPLLLEMSPKDAESVSAGVVQKLAALASSNNAPRQFAPDEIDGLTANLARYGNVAKWQAVEAFLQDAKVGDRFAHHLSAEPPASIEQLFRSRSARLRLLSLKARMLQVASTDDRPVQPAASSDWYQQVAACSRTLPAPETKVATTTTPEAKSEANDARRDVETELALARTCRAVVVAFAADPREQLRELAATIPKDDQHPWAEPRRALDWARGFLARKGNLRTEATVVDEAAKVLPDEVHGLILRKGRNDSLLTGMLPSHDDENDFDLEHTVFRRSTFVANHFGSPSRDTYDDRRIGFVHNRLLAAIDPTIEVRWLFDEATWTSSTAAWQTMGAFAAEWQVVSRGDKEMPWTAEKRVQNACITDLRHLSETNQGSPPTSQLAVVYVGVNGYPAVSLEEPSGEFLLRTARRTARAVFHADQARCDSESTLGFGLVPVHETR